MVLSRAAAGKNPIPDEIAACYAVEPTFCAATLYSFSGRSETTLGEAAELHAGTLAADDFPDFWNELHQVVDRSAEAEHEVLKIFGEHTAGVITRSTSMKAATALRQLRHAIWMEQFLGFQPAPLADWLRATYGDKQSLSPQATPIVAQCFVKLLDDALLQDSHLLPPAVAEIVCAKVMHGHNVHCEPWLMTGPADLLLILRGDSLSEIGRAIQDLRRVTLGEVMGAGCLDGGAGAGPFTTALRKLFHLEPDSRIHAWFVDRGDDATLPWPDADAFVRDLRLVNTTRPLIGLRRGIMQELAESCRQISRGFIQAKSWSDPGRYVEEFCAEAFCPYSPIHRVLKNHSLDSDATRYPTTLKLRIRPGRDLAVHHILECIRKQTPELITSNELPHSSRMSLGIVAEVDIQPFQIAIPDGIPMWINWRTLFGDVHLRGRSRRLIAAILEDFSVTRIHGGIKGLFGPEPLVEPLQPEKSLDGEEWKAYPEALTGPSTLIDIAFLERLLAVSRSVCRLEMTLHSFVGKRFYSTGFLIGPRKVMTCHHCMYPLGDNRRCDGIVARFNYQNSPGGALEAYDAFRGQPETVASSREDDWAIFELDADPPEDRYPPLTLHRSASVCVGDRVFIIQHPDGKSKKISMQRNFVTSIDHRNMRYLADTLEGSSGSPIFDARCDVVGIHCRCVIYSDAETRRADIRNEGVLVPRILESAPVR